MDLMGQLHRMDKDQVLEFVCACYNESDGGFAPALHHDSHLIYTLSAIQVGGANTGRVVYRRVHVCVCVQVLMLYDRKDLVDVEKVVGYVCGLQCPDDGSFMGDQWGEEGVALWGVRF